MPKLHWEDFKPGQVTEYGPRLVTRDEIIAFATEFDPQPMHLDEAAGRASLLKGLAASGWHSCCILIRMICDGFLLNSASMGANAIDEVKWLSPLRPGDSVTLRATVRETRASKSRPDMGLIHFHYEMMSQNGECIMTLDTPMMMGRRSPGAAS